MRFILVQCKNNDYGQRISQWRATHIGATTVDIFFWAADESAARLHVLRRFPSAMFSGDPGCG